MSSFLSLSKLSVHAFVCTPLADVFVVAVHVYVFACVEQSLVKSGDRVLLDFQVHL